MKKLVTILIILCACLPAISQSKVLHFPKDNLYIFMHPAVPERKNVVVVQDEEKDNNHYELLEFHIGSTMIFNINEYTPVKFIIPMINSFTTWRQAAEDNIFDIQSFGTTSKSWYQNDGENVVSFVKFTPRDYIAFAAIYYDPNTLMVVDTDIVLNALLKWDVGSSKAFDVENIMAHEVGHVLGLADLYLSIYSELTMYGYGEKGEIKKRTLENGDILGAQFLYGIPY